MADMPPSRALLAVDVEKFSGHPGVALTAVRETVRDVVWSALRRVGVDREADVERCDDTGDGLIIALRDERTHVLVDAAHYLNRELRTRKRTFDGPPLRMRVAVHCGPIDRDEGSGTAKIELCRMLDAEELRTALAGTASYVALAVSDQVFRTAVCDGYAETVDKDVFHRVDIAVKSARLVTWMHVPNNDWPAVGTAARIPASPGLGSGPASVGPGPHQSEQPSPPAAPQPVAQSTSQPAARAESPLRGGIHIGSVTGNAVTGEVVNGGVHHTVNSDNVHGRKGDDVYGDKRVGGA